MQKTELEEASQLLQQHGVLEQEQLSKLPHLGPDELLQLLTRQINYLLERDMERLMQSLYRIDVPEQKFKEALMAEKPAEQIAELILQRELLKVKTRRWYANRTAASTLEGLSLN